MYQATLLLSTSLRRTLVLNNFIEQMNEEQNINQLPKDWKWVKLGEVCEKVEAVKRKEKKPEEELLYLDIGGIDNSANKILSHKNYKWKDAPSRAQQIVFKDDILFSTVRTYMKNIAVVENKIYDGQIASSGFCVIRSDKKVTNPKFVFYYTVSQNFLRPLNELQTGSSYPAVRDKDVFIQPFPLPPQPTQQAIVSKIEELFSELDKGIENLHTAQQQLKIYRQSVLKWAFEGKLTEEWREQHNHLLNANELIIQIQNEKERIAKASGKKVKSIASISNDELEELFEIPKQWAFFRNEDYLFEVKDGTHDTPKYQDAGIPFVTQKNIREAGLDFSNVQFISEQDHIKFYQRSNVAKNDILISMIGHNRGMTAIVDIDKVFSIKNVGLFKFLPSFQSHKFSFYYYQSRVGLNMVLKKSKGGAQPFIGLTELRNWAVVVCSLEEQNQIVQEIESRLSVADKMEESITQSLQQAEALRQSILKKAFEGRLV